MCALAGEGGGGGGGLVNRRSPAPESRFGSKDTIGRGHKVGGQRCSSGQGLHLQCAVHRGHRAPPSCRILRRRLAHKHADGVSGACIMAAFLENIADAPASSHLWNGVSAMCQKARSKSWDRWVNEHEAGEKISIRPRGGLTSLVQGCDPPPKKKAKCNFQPFGGQHHTYPPVLCPFFAQAHSKTWQP